MGLDEIGQPVPDIGPALGWEPRKKTGDERADRQSRHDPQFRLHTLPCEKHRSDPYSDAVLPNFGTRDVKWRLRIEGIWL